MAETRKVMFLEGDLGKWALSSVKASTGVFLQRLACKIVTNPLDADIIYSVWHRNLADRYKYLLVRILKAVRPVKVVCGVTHFSSSYEEEVGKLTGLVDYWTVPNLALYELFRSKGLKVELVPFFADKAVFYRRDLSKKEICKTLGIDYERVKGKFLIGSFQRDSLGGDLGKPKWQKNPDLLIKILRALPKNKYLLVLSSPRRHYLIKKCIEFDLPYLFLGDHQYISNLEDDLLVNNQDAGKIALLYNLIDLYLVSSRVEGGPLASLEAPLTKTLVMSTNVGLSPDVLHPDLIYSEDDFSKAVSFIEGIVSGARGTSSYIQHNYLKASHALDEAALLVKYGRLIER